MKLLYTLGIIAAILVVFLAPNPDHMFERLAFILAALALGYIVLRHRFKLRYYIRLKHAFNTDKHQSKRWARQYRRNKQLTFLTA